MPADIDLDEVFRWLELPIPTTKFAFDWKFDPTTKTYSRWRHFPSILAADIVYSKQKHAYTASIYENVLPTIEIKSFSTIKQAKLYVDNTLAEYHFKTISTHYIALQ